MSKRRINRIHRYLCKRYKFPKKRLKEKHKDLLASWFDYISNKDSITKYFKLVFKIRKVVSNRAYEEIRDYTTFLHTNEHLKTRYNGKDIVSKVNLLLI